MPEIERNVSQVFGEETRLGHKVVSRDDLGMGQDEFLVSSVKNVFASLKSIVLKIVGGIASVAIVLLIITEAFPNEVRNLIMPGTEVRNAYLTQYSEKITIEGAFNSFFGSHKWRTYKEKGCSYVIFTGSCIVMDKTSDVRITFKITGENFVVEELEVNGQEQSKLLLDILLARVYAEYQNKSGKMTYS